LALNALVIDDEPVIRELCTRWLSAEGFEVESAAGAADALAMLTRHYDVILLDARMPCVSGLQLYETIGSVNAGLLNQVIFMTGDTLNHDMLAALGRTGRPIIAKPFTQDDLSRVVRKTVKGLDAR